MAQDPHESTLDMTIYSEHIMSPLKKDFPNVCKLMQYNMMGTLQLLKSLNIVVTKKGTESVAADHEGDDRVKTWFEYKGIIKENLQKMPGLSGWRETKACEEIENVIYQQFYKKFPRWPEPGMSYSGYIDVTCCGTYSAQKGYQKFQVTWSGEGSVQVRMKTVSTGLRRRYCCELDGKPTFKILYFDLMKLKQVEGRFGQNMTQLKAKVDTLNKK